jgi:hypothetical protein
MSGIERPSVEILVHTTAPSRGQDDARYRAMARAHLDFEPACRLTIDQSPDSEVEDEEPNSELQEEPESQASYRPDHESGPAVWLKVSSQDSHLEHLSPSQAIPDSPDLSFNSVLDNADSPIFRGRLGRLGKLPAGTQTVMQNSMDSWQPPPSIIADSQPDNDLAMAEVSSPTRMPELFLHQIESSKVRSLGVAQGVETGIQLSNANNQSQSLVKQEQARPITSSGSPLPTPKNLTEIRSHRVLRHRKQSTYPQCPEGTAKRKHLDLSSDPIHTSPCASDKKAANARSKIPPSSTRPQKLQRIEAAPEMITSPKAIDPPSSPAPSGFRSSFTSVLQVLPPPPVTSMGSLTPDGLRTESMEQLARKIPLHILYRPQHQARELRDMERGHWLVTCETWTDELRSATWDCLGTFIDKGQAGWGVWCVRDADFGTVRVYCWGAVVGYVYLLLYMASESKIKGTGACWIGGDGKVVIQMPS